MAAATRNIIIEKGATFSRTLALKDSEGAAVDLTDATVVAKFRQRPQDSDSVTFTTTVTSPATGGTIQWEIADNVTVTLPTGDGQYDLTVTYADGTSQRLLEGKATVKPWIGGAD